MRQLSIPAKENRGCTGQLSISTKTTANVSYKRLRYDKISIVLKLNHLPDYTTTMYIKQIKQTAAKHDQ